METEILYLMASTALGILVVTFCAVVALDLRERRHEKRRARR